MKLDDFRKPERLTKTVPTKVAPSDYDRLTAVAERFDISVSAVVRVFVLKGLKNLEDDDG